MPTFFSNQQWDVTDYGIEAHQPDQPIYEVGKSRLTETRNGINGHEYNWLPHMAEKEWVDIDAFIEAYTQALVCHAGAYKPKADLELLKKSINRARAVRRQLLRLAELTIGPSGPSRFIDFASGGLPDAFFEADTKPGKSKRSDDMDAAPEARPDEK